MDRDLSFERRYSFNASIRNPAAESTKLNHSNANRSGLSTSFKWGSSPISPKQRNNSSTNLMHFDSTVGSVDFSHASPRSKNMLKIDPRIVADVQSKGLASRIVKYHENGNRLNRSMSAHNLYAKPGQFPVVTLKKTELPYRASKQNVSMTRIAPPEKASFYGNTLSSLLRSNSIVGLHKSDEDISRENRPILHPPPTENDMAPTRSVLDELKEISRKRINSEDPEVVEKCKKNRISNDLVDKSAQTVMTQSYKRRRAMNFLPNGDVISPTKNNDSTFSPEQAKKRVCSYNNDITSSLSSSIKRKPDFGKRLSSQLNQTMPTRLEAYEIQKHKTQRIDNNNTTSTNIETRYDKLENSTITTSQTDGPVPLSLEVNGYGTIPTRSKSVPLPYESGITATSNNKPRLTLFNKAYDVDNVICETVEVEDKSNESGECAGIQFVKPKKILSSGLKNPVIERAQKSKLALMLSGLRGELYHENDNDELDASSKTKQDSNMVNVSKAVEVATTVVPTTTSVSLTSTSITSSNATSTLVATASKQPEKPGSVNNNTLFPLMPPTSNSSPLVGLKLSPPTTTAAYATPKQNPITTFTKPILEGFVVSTAASTLVPTSALNTTTSAGSLGTPVNFAATTQPTFAFKPVTNANTDAPKSTENAYPLANISFGNIAKSATATAPTINFTFGTSNSAATTSASTMPSLTATVAPSVSVSSPSSTATVSTNSFSFGTTMATASTQQSSKQNTTLSLQPVVSASSNQNFTFGTQPVTSIASTQAPSFASQAVTTSAPSTTLFSFGLNTNAQSNSLAKPTEKPSGGFSFGNITTTPATNTQLTFVPSTASSNSAANSFTFGSSINEKTSMFSAEPPKVAPTMTETNKSAFAIPTSAPAVAVFGSAASTTASNIFGGTNTGGQPNLFASTNKQSQTLFGSASASKSFFGSDTSKPSATVTAFGSTTSTPVGFGQPTANNAASISKPVASTGGFNFGTAVAAAPANSTFTFGSSNNSTNQNSSSSVPAAPSQQSKTFSFGGSSTIAPEKNNTSSIFGGSAAPTNSSSGGFSFGAAANTTTKPAEPASSGGFSFGSAAKPAATVQKPSAAFSFGAANSSAMAGNTSLPTPSGGFSFGATMQQTVNESTTSKPFTFGSSATPTNSNQTMAAPNSNQNLFATNMMNKTGAAPAFNFGSVAPSTPQATVAPATANNIFAPPATMGGPGDRPIRRATRRLQK